VVSWLKSLFKNHPTNPSSEVKSSVLDSNPINLTPNPVVQTDVAQTRKMRRLRKSIDQQLQSRSAMKPHAVDCSIVQCNKPLCFIREPDKIVSEPYEVER
jgi:hypothetical protein